MPTVQAAYLAPMVHPPISIVRSKNKNRGIYPAFIWEMKVLGLNATGFLSTCDIERRCQHIVIEADQFGGLDGDGAGIAEDEDVRARDRYARLDIFERVVILVNVIAHGDRGFELYTVLERLRADREHERCSVIPIVGELEVYPGRGVALIVFRQVIA